MRDLYLDDDGGVDFNSTVSDITEIVQSLRIILETEKGEFVESATLGLDRTDLMQKNFDARYAEQSIREALEQDSRVTVENVEVNADFNQRIASMELNLIADGTVVQTEVTLDVG